MFYYTRGEKLEHSSLNTQKTVNYLKTNNDTIIHSFAEIIEKLNQTIKQTSIALITEETVN